MWRKMVLVLYVALLACNFLFIPWKLNVSAWRTSRFSAIPMDKQGFESGWVFIGPGAPRTLNADTDWVDFVERPTTTVSDSESALTPTNQELRALATPDIPRVLRRTVVILAFMPLILVLSVPGFVFRIAWAKVVLFLYIALLSCNFLYVPWRGVDSQTRLNLDDPQHYYSTDRRGHYQFLPGNHWLWDADANLMTPAVSVVLLRGLAILVFAPLIVRPCQARITIAKTLQRLALHIAPSEANPKKEEPATVRS